MPRLGIRKWDMSLSRNGDLPMHPQETREREVSSELLEMGICEEGGDANPRACRTSHVGLGPSHQERTINSSALMIRIEGTVESAADREVA